MEVRTSSRMYGAVDEPAHHSSLPRSDNGQDVTMTSEAHLLPSRVRERSSSRSWLAVALICALGIGTVAVTNRSGSSAGISSTMQQHPDLQERVSDSTRSEHQTGQPGLQDSTSGALEFHITNFYHTRDGKPGAQIPWLRGVKLAEPYMDTTLQVLNARDDHTYDWIIRSMSGDEEILATASGPEVVMLFTRLDENAVTMEEKDSTGRVTRELTEVVMVKYVRREIRTLTDEDREELLDSMLKLWTERVDSGNGKELYGDDYADIWAINRLHFKAASPLVCDHFHDGMGFLTSHGLLTNTFEFSLQRVNPKFALPYWDFTIETSTAGGNTPDKIEPQIDSPLLQDSWFGTMDPADSMVKNSRWAYTEIPRLKINNPGQLEADVYSKLRAPWNVNDRAYLSRGFGSMCGVRVEPMYNWPTCESHYELNTLYDDFYSWVWTSLYGPHGPVHVWLGGVLDCDETYAKIKDLVGPDIATNMAYYSFVHRKNLYRDGLFSCEGQAGVSTKPGDIFERKQCGCLDYNLEDGDDYLTIKNSFVHLSSWIDDFPGDVQREVVATLCNGVMNDGDHLQASSSLDPSFWVTHPTMERLFMFKRLTGTMTDLTWPDEDTTYVNDEGETVVESLSLYSEECNGHRGKDVFPFNLASDDGSSDFKARTQIRGDTDAGNTINNRDILQLMDPRLNTFNYIYDNFDWKHCAEDGYNFNDVWGTNKMEAVRGERPTFKHDEKRYPRFKFVVEEARRQEAEAKAKSKA